MKISPLNSLLIKGVAHIESECFAHPWSEQSIEEYYNNPNAAFFTATDDDGSIVGYIGSYQVVDEVYVTNVAVLPQYRRQGIGRDLVARVCDYARGNGASFVTLEVRQSNLAAMLLYQSLGFLIDGTRPNFYRDPEENALIMTLRF